MTTNGNSKVINDLEYDLLAVLKNKSDAVQLYDTYVKDAESAGSQPCVELLKRIQEEDRKHAEEVRNHLKEVMQKGKM